MELKTFIKNTLNQIVDGVREAQAEDGGDAINPTELHHANAGGNVISALRGSAFVRVDFDVAVSAESKGGGKGSLMVWGIGVEGGGEHKAGTANRIAFSVPVKLPRPGQGS